MKDFNLGKKLYISRALPTAKIFLLCVCVGLLVNFYHTTLADPVFIKRGFVGLRAVWRFHMMYPEELISFILFVIAPSLYYGLIRGITFFEKGIVINRGLPFFNHCVRYDNIKEYRMVNRNYLMSVIRKDTEDEILFTICNPDRAVAIMDQQEIRGKLGGEDYVKTMSAHKKFFLFVIFFGILVFFIQYFGIIGMIFR